MLDAQVGYYDKTSNRHFVFYRCDSKWEWIDLSTVHFESKKKISRTTGLNIGDVLMYTYKNDLDENDQDNGKPYRIMILGFSDQRSRVHILYLETGDYEEINNNFSPNEVIWHCPTAKPTMHVDSLKCVCNQINRTLNISNPEGTSLSKSTETRHKFTSLTKWKNKRRAERRRINKQKKRSSTRTNV